MIRSRQEVPRAVDGAGPLSGRNRGFREPWPHRACFWRPRSRTSSRGPARSPSCFHLRPSRPRQASRRRPVPPVPPRDLPSPRRRPSLWTFRLVTHSNPPTPAPPLTSVTTPRPPAPPLLPERLTLAAMAPEAQAATRQESRSSPLCRVAQAIRGAGTNPGPQLPNRQRVFPPRQHPRTSIRTSPCTARSRASPRVCQRPRRLPQHRRRRRTLGP